MRKPAFAYAKIKAQISFAVTRQLISACVFATKVVQTLFFLSPKFQAFTHSLCLNNPVSAKLVGDHEDRFSRDAAHKVSYRQILLLSFVFGQTGLGKQYFFFLIQFNVPFKIISLIETSQSIGGAKWENHLTHPQAELGLSHMWPVRGLNLHQTQW